MPALLEGTATRPASHAPSGLIAGCIGAVGLCLVAACTTGPSGNRLATVRDSAGITIVDNADDAAQLPHWRVSQSAAITLGGIDPGDPGGLFHVVGAHRLADGGIAVANAGTNELKIYSEAGRLLQSVGGAGNGPAQFRRLGALIGMESDSLLVWDSGLERASVFDGAGRYARSFRFDDDVDPIVVPVGTAAGDVFAMKASHVTDIRNDGITIDSARILRFGTDGSLHSSPGRFEQNRRYRKSSGGLDTTIPVPFSPRGVLVVRSADYCTTSAVVFVIECHDLNGRLERIVRLEREPLAVTDWMVERLFDDVSDGDSPLNRRLEQVRQDLPIPTHLPAISRMQADRQHNLWVAPYPEPDSWTRPSTWYVFRQDGQIIARAEIPPQFMPFEIGADYVIGVTFDSMGVEYVTIHCLARSEGDCADPS